MADDPPKPPVTLPSEDFPSLPQRNSSADPAQSRDGLARQLSAETQRPVPSYWLDRLAEERREAKDLRGDIAGAVEQHEPTGNKMADPKPESAHAMHPRDAKLFADLGIPAAILVGVGVAGLGGIFAGWIHTGVALSALGFGGALAMRLRLVETKPPPPLAAPLWRASLVAVAATTWAFVAWQAWLSFHSPTQGYTQAQVDEAVAKASSAAKTATGSPFGATFYTDGTIGWVLDSQFLVTSYGDSGDVINSVILQGKSKNNVGFKEAYAISNLTGHRQSFLIDVPFKGAFRVSMVDIPPQADVQLEMHWEPPLTVRDFLDQWGKFHVVIVYDDGTTWEHDFDEAYVRDRLNRQIPSALGPRVTLKDVAK